MNNNGLTANNLTKYDHLGELAKQAVICTMQKGELTHPVNDFMSRAFTEHYDHALEHLYECEKEFCENPKDELEHALTRVTILLVKLEEGRCKKMDLESVMQEFNKSLVEFGEQCKSVFGFLDEYESVDHIPEPKSIEIFTLYAAENSILLLSNMERQYVDKISDLIPTHLEQIKKQLNRGKKVYVRVKTEITTGKLHEIGLYTRLILI
jgi:hypothetical protein